MLRIPIFSTLTPWLLALTLIVLPDRSGAMEEVATISDSVGHVVVERGGKRFRTIIGFPLYQGDIVNTGKTGKARLLMKDNSVLSIGPTSKLQLSALKLVEDKRSFSIDVLLGRFKMDMAKWFRGDTEGQISTPTAVAGVRGTVVWGDTELDAICALEGEIELESKNGGKAKEAKDGDCYTGMKEGKTELLKPTETDLLKFLDEVTIR